MFVNFFYIHMNIIHEQTNYYNDQHCVGSKNQCRIILQNRTTISMFTEISIFVLTLV